MSYTRSQYHPGHKFGVRSGIHIDKSVLRGVDPQGWKAEKKFTFDLEQSCLTSDENLANFCMTTGEYLQHV